MTEGEELVVRDVRAPELLRRRDLAELEAVEAEIEQRSTGLRYMRIIAAIGLPLSVLLIWMEGVGRVSTDLGTTVLSMVVAMVGSLWWTHRHRPIADLEDKRSEMLARLEGDDGDREPASSTPPARLAHAPMDPSVERALRELEIEVAAAELRRRASASSEGPLKVLAGFFLSVGVLFVALNAFNPWLDLWYMAIPFPILAAGTLALSRSIGRRDARKEALLQEKGGLFERKLEEHPEFVQLSDNALHALAGEYNAERGRSLLKSSWMTSLGFSLTMAGVVMLLIDAPFGLALEVVGLLLFGVGALRWDRQSLEEPEIESILLDDATD